MKKLSMLFFSIVFAFAVMQCKEKSPDQLEGFFTFIKGNVTVNGKQARVGGKIVEKDTVKVGENAGGVIQFVNSALLTMRPDTEIKVSDLAKSENGQPIINIAQNSGSTFHKIQKGSAKYKVATPTAVAGVRGTSFSISFDGTSTSSVKLLEGKVAVKKVEAKKADGKSVVDEDTAFSDFENETFEEPAEGEITKTEVLELNTGEKAEISEASEKTQKAQMLDVEKKQLQAMNQVLMVPVEKLREKSEDPEAVIASPVDSSVQEKIAKPEAEVEKEMLKEDEAATNPGAGTVAPKKVTLEDLRKQYGPLSQVTTKAGKSYIGAFQQVGQNMVITTVNGKVSVPVSDVAKVSPYN